MCNSSEIFKKEIKHLCSYDKSEEEGLASCCHGTYNLIGEEANSGEWGKDLKQCIGGLARLNWNTFDKYGRPVVLVTQSGSQGVNEDYELKPLLDGVDAGYRYSLPQQIIFQEWRIKNGKQRASLPFTPATQAQEKKNMQTRLFSLGLA